MVLLQVLSEGIPQVPGYRGKGTDPIPTAPASPKYHQTPAHGLERVGWCIENQKLRKVGCNANNRRASYLEKQCIAIVFNLWGKEREIGIG